MGGIHMGASAAFLNGTGPLGNNGDFNLIESKKSIDQYIADAIAGDTPLRSLELGTEDMGTSAGACDGYPCVFFNTMSWYDDQQPAAGLGEPAGHVRAHVRRPRHAGAAPRSPAGEAEHARLGHARDEASAEGDRREATTRSSTSTSPTFVASRSSCRRCRRARARSRVLRTAPRNPRGLRRAHDGHVRPAASGVPGRHHARVQLHARPRGERPKLRARRRQRAAPLDVAPQEHAGEPRPVRAHRRRTTWSSSASSSRS